MEIPEERDWRLKQSDITTFTKKASGAGGQHVNTTDSCVVMRHEPTGIEAMASARCQHVNRRLARAMLEIRVREHFESSRAAAHNAERLEKRGSGMRADKIKTYRAQDDTVTNHLTGTKYRLKDALAGKI